MHTLTARFMQVLQDGGQKVNSIFERARALGATEGSIADLQQPSSSGKRCKIGQELTHLLGFQMVNVQVTCLN